jgi:spectinomycin phosphotransferase
LKAEPSLDRAALVETLWREYGLDVDGLAFLPAGWVAYCYVVNCVGGGRYFLKLYGDSGPVPLAASDLDFYLPLTYQLCTTGLLPCVACPVESQSGSLTAHMGSYLLILFRFIDGRVVGHDGLSGEVLAKLARMVGILHRSTREIEVENPFYERFDIAFEDDLLSGLDVLERVTACDRRGKRALRELLLPRRGELLGHLQRLKELQALARAAGKEMVVCHTDLHGENLMVDEQGNLYILDWEGAMIAPPEHDLFFFAGYDMFWDMFLPNYEREFGPASLNSDVFGFYYYRRNLEDLVDYVVRILHHHTDDQRDEEDLREIAEYCIAGWPYIEVTIREIEERLAQRREGKGRRASSRVL